MPVDVIEGADKYNHVLKITRRSGDPCSVEQVIGVNNKSFMANTSILFNKFDRMFVVDVYNYPNLELIHSFLSPRHVDLSTLQLGEKNLLYCRFGGDIDIKARTWMSKIYVSSGEWRLMSKKSDKPSTCNHKMKFPSSPNIVRTSRTIHVSRDKPIVIKPCGNNISGDHDSYIFEASGSGESLITCEKRYTTTEDEGLDITFIDTTYGSYNGPSFELA